MASVFMYSRKEANIRDSLQVVNSPEKAIKHMLTGIAMRGCLKTVRPTA